MDSDTGEPMDQFDPQQQMVYVTEDGSQYIYSADQAAAETAEGMVSYIYGDDGTATAMAADPQSSDGDVQYLLVSADEASSLTAQPQFVVMPPDAVAGTSGMAAADTSKATTSSVVIRKRDSPEKVKGKAGAASSMVATGDEGTTAEVKVKGGGTAKVTILPSMSKSPGTSSVATIPIRIVSRTDSSVVVSTQTISLPIKSSPKVSVSVKSSLPSMTSAVVSLPKVSASGSAESSPAKKAIRGRTRRDVQTKDPLHQLSSPGGVTKHGKSPNVIVVPIQISKEMIAAKQGEKAAAASGTAKSKESPKKASPKANVDGDKKGSEAGDSDKDSKETPKGATKAKKAPTPKPETVEQKSEQSSPEPTRRSKRESKMSVKLAEWGLLPSAGPRQSAAEAAESEEDEDIGVKEAEAKEVKEVKKDKKKKPVDTAAEDDEDEDEDEDENVPLSKTVVSKAAAAATAALKKTLTTISKESGSQTPSTSRQQPTPSTSVLKKTPASKTPSSTKTPVTTVTKTIIAASSGAKTATPSSVSRVSTTVSASGSTTKLLQNKSLMCKPIMMTKATSCNPIRITKATQTDEDNDTVDTGGGSKTVLPVPVPIFLPAPMAMYNAPTPYPLPVPLPIPVPCFVPTTRNSIAAIMKQLKELHDSLPSDPAEADLLKMAEAVADASDDADCAPSSAKKSGEGSVDVLEMALRMASEPQDSEGKGADKKANGEVEPEAKRQRIAVDGLEDDDDQPVATPLFVDEPLRGPPPAPVVHAPIDDSQMRLKYTYGINAWKQWVTAKNAELEAAGSGGRGGASRPKLFKSEILQCSAEELNVALSLFVREVRKPTGQTYAADSIYYLCLGIQHYLFENGRVDNIFTDVYYERFTDALHELLSTHELHLNTQGMIVCRVSEEHLWEARLLGAHSPRVLLNTLVYFNTKYFMLQTAESHLSLSFSNILKQWKKNSTIDGKPIRSVYLRYNTVGFSPAQSGSQGLDPALQRRRTLDPTPFEQLENIENPLRCPVKLYEFYLSKCPESIRNRNDVFYLTPEPSCVPDSPVWYSAQPLSVEAMNKMLSRIRVVREIQETQLNQAPTATQAAIAGTVFG